MTRYSRIMWRYGGWELVCTVAISALIIVGDVIEAVRGRGP